MGFFADLVDNVGTTFNLPELGFSENISGGKPTTNTGRVAYASSPGQNGSNYTITTSSGKQVAANDPNYNAYQQALAIKNASARPTSTSGGGGGGGASDEDILGALRALGGGGGGSGGGGVVDAATLAAYDDQIAAANDALNRINNQRGVGLQNIDSSYNQAYNKLVGSNALAERNAGINRQDAVDSNVNARATVDSSVARQANSLRRLLGNNSSAALFAAPLAVANQGAQQQNTIQQSFGKNLRSLDLADEDRKNQYNSNLGDLDYQRTTSRNQLESGLKSNEATTLQQLQQLATAKASAAGQTYQQARATTQGYQDRISGLLSSIDQLGLNPSIQAKNVTYTAPTLESYNPQSADLSLGNNPQAQTAGQYSYLLGQTDDKRKQLGVL